MLKVGQVYELTYYDDIAARAVARAQHASSGSIGTRDAGENYNYRLWGCMGELVVARLLNIKPQIRDFGGPDPNPDIVLLDGTKIEVKVGFPMEAKSKLRRDATYVVLRMRGQTFEVTHLRKGDEIFLDAMEPPEYMCNRPGTQHENWLIQNAKQPAAV